MSEKPGIYYCSFTIRKFYEPAAGVLPPLFRISLAKNGFLSTFACPASRAFYLWCNIWLQSVVKWTETNPTCEIRLS